MSSTTTKKAKRNEAGGEKGKGKGKGKVKGKGKGKEKKKPAGQGLPKRKEDVRNLSSLEAFLFGEKINDESFGQEINTMQTEDQSKRKRRRKGLKSDTEHSPEVLFIEDKTGDSTLLETDADVQNLHSSSTEEDKEKDKEEEQWDGSEARDEKQVAPAWEDEDDAQLELDFAATDRLRKLRKTHRETVVKGAEINKRLREKFVALHSQGGEAVPDWAKIDFDNRESDNDTDSAADSLLRSTERLAGHDGKNLAMGKLGVVRLADLNQADRKKGPIHAVAFHPGGQLAFTASLDKTIRLFQVDGTRNPKLQSIHLSDLPIYSCAFTADGNEILASGRRKFFYSLDLNTGTPRKIPFIRGRSEKAWEKFTVSPDNQLILFHANDGAMVMLDRRSMQNVSTIKMNGLVKSTAFNRDGSQLFSANNQGQVYVWDVRSLRCREKFQDEGSIKGSVLAVNGSYFACGSDSGVVNLYSYRDRKQLSSFMQLTTEVDCLSFHPSSELLVASSKKSKDALKVYHVASRTCFSNWPTNRTPMGHVNAIGFSPSGGYLVIGTMKGKALLYRLTHYPQS